MLRCMFFNITFQIATGIFFLLEGIKIAVLQRAYFKENNKNIKFEHVKYSLSIKENWNNKKYNNTEHQYTIDALA